MISPQEAYTQSTTSRKEIMDKFENDNPDIIEAIECAIDEGISLGHVYGSLDSSLYDSEKIPEIISFLRFIGYSAENDSQRNSIWVNWNQRNQTS